MEELREHIASLESELTPAFVERIVRELLQQRKDGGSGVGAASLVKCLTSNLTLRGEEFVWACHRLKSALMAAVEQIPSLHFLEGG